MYSKISQGRVKCVQYWPPHGQMLHFDDLSLLTLDEEEIHPGLMKRTIEVRELQRQEQKLKENRSRTINRNIMTISKVDKGETMAKT